MFATATYQTDSENPYKDYIKQQADGKKQWKKNIDVL